MPNSPNWFYNNQKNHAANLPAILRPIRKRLYEISRKFRLQVNVRFDNDPKAYVKLVMLAEKYGRSTADQLKRMAFPNRP